MGARIISCGLYLPEKCLTNDDLSKMVDTSDAWIRQRTGISTRHIAADGQVTSDLGALAAQDALKKAGLKASDVDLIVCATSTPDEVFPSVAARIQGKIGMGAGAAFDVQAVCGGFVFALSVAETYLKTKQFRRALVIGAETLSRIVDWHDRTTCVLFGDGAGAMVLDHDEDPNKGILGTKLYSDGSLHDILFVNGGVSSTQGVGYIQMNGREVYRHAIEKMGQAVLETTNLAGYMPQDISWIVPHQANLRIMTALADKLGLPQDRVIVDVDRHANTSAATIPLATCRGMAEGKIKPGDLVAFTALGAGLAWGAALVRW